MKPNDFSGTKYLCLTLTADGAGELPGAPEGCLPSVPSWWSLLIHPANVQHVQPLLWVPRGRGLQGPLLQLVRGQQLQGVSGGQRHQKPQLCV